MSRADTLPTDDFSQMLRRLMDHPDAASSASTIDVQTILGHSETWVVRTVRAEGSDTLFLQRINADGGQRFVLPPLVMAAITRQRETLLSLGRRRAARKAVATRRAK